MDLDEALAELDREILVALEERRRYMDRPTIADFASGYAKGLRAARLILADVDVTIDLRETPNDR